jgi:hypothetical protein
VLRGGKNPDKTVRFGAPLTLNVEGGVGSFAC